MPGLRDDQPGEDRGSHRYRHHHPAPTPTRDVPLAGDLHARSVATKGSGWRGRERSAGLWRHPGAVSRRDHWELGDPSAGLRSPQRPVDLLVKRWARIGLGVRRRARPGRRAFDWRILAPRRTPPGRAGRPIASARAPPVRRSGHDCRVGARRRRGSSPYFQIRSFCVIWDFTRVMMLRYFSARERGSTQSCGQLGELLTGAPGDRDRRHRRPTPGDDPSVDSPGTVGKRPQERWQVVGARR